MRYEGINRDGKAVCGFTTATASDLTAAKYAAGWRELVVEEATALYRWEIRGRIEQVDGRRVCWAEMEDWELDDDGEPTSDADGPLELEEFQIDEPDVGRLVVAADEWLEL